MWDWFPLQMYESPGSLLSQTLSSNWAISYATTQGLLRAHHQEYTVQLLANAEHWPSVEKIGDNVLLEPFNNSDVCGGNVNTFISGIGLINGEARKILYLFERVISWVGENYEYNDTPVYSYTRQHTLMLFKTVLIGRLLTDLCKSLPLEYSSRTRSRTHRQYWLFK